MDSWFGFKIFRYILSCLFYFLVPPFFLKIVCFQCVSYQSVGADVDQVLFRGFATTAAVREDHLEILGILIKAGASQLACEEALLEASCHGRPRLSELLMESEMIRPHIAVHALVTASCRGFVDVVDTLIKVLKSDATVSIVKLFKTGKNDCEPSHQKIQWQVKL